LAVNVGENPRAAREFADKLPVHFTILMDRDVRATKAWGAKLLPVSFLVGPDGSIRYSYLGDLDWSSAQVREKVESLLPKQDQRAQLRP
ncbi:MAG: TlpA family protein disulfide reductase, partial [Betaproteobacteria bacterium]|nr:TlpA family protein disulfide reductase [Betaproteobacteria bacterium]